MRKVWCVTLIVVIFGLFDTNNVLATPKQVVDQFIEKLIQHEHDSAKTYMFDKSMEIPELLDTTLIGKFDVLTTPTRDDTQIVIAYFKEEHAGERIAFIWELIVRDEKISHIKVIHDGNKPLLEEAKLVKDYEMMFHCHVLVPDDYPFVVTGFDGMIDEKQEILHLGYRIASLNSYLHIAIFPVTVDLDRFIGKDTQILKLRDGTKVLYRGNYDLAYEIRFQKDGFNYKMALGKKNLTQQFTADDLLKIAESMK
jgi:hypothetical protein